MFVIELKRTCELEAKAVNIECFGRGIRNPQGHKLPDEGETRFSGNVFALTAENGQFGILITPETGECQWGGEQMDDDLSILCMLQLD